MFLKLLVCACSVISFLGVKSQRAWGSNGGYNSGFSNTWNSNTGYSVSNNNPSIVNNNNGGSWGSNSFGLGGRPNESPFQSSSSNQNSNWGYGTMSNDKSFGQNQNKPGKVNSGNSARQPDSSRRPNEKKSSPIMNPPNTSKWNTNTNTFATDENDNSAFSSWDSNNAKLSGQNSNQNSKPGDWMSNNLNNNKQSENEIPNNSDYEDNSIYSSWSSNNKKKTEPTSNQFGGSGNRETTTQKTNKNSGNSKWETNSDKKPKKPLGSNGRDPNGSTQVGKEESQGTDNAQNERQPSAVDTSILDELDKNDWYFGKESNYPKPPFRSTLNIDVSELWNFNKNRKPSENSRGNNNNSNNNSRGNNNSSNNNNNNKSNNNNNNSNNSRGTNNNNNNNKNNNKRRNRQIERVTHIQCECVNIKLCEEEDMIITQEDVKFDVRPLEEFTCEKLTDVCCTNPKLQLSSRANFNEEKEVLGCGERRLSEKPFEGLGDNIAQPGEFPWSLRIENAEFNCSASLIHHKLALTAAHCVTGALPNELRLKAGIWNSNNEPSQSRKVSKIIPHPDYNSRSPRNDIALLILETPFELTDNVNTICLPVTNDKWDSNQCVVAGWKQEEIHGQVLDVLEKGIVNFLPQPECQNIMLVTDLWRNYVLHDSFVCGLEKTGRKTCTGDEGGFLICPSKKRPGTYLQIGIVSKGMNCDEFGRPGIFTNVLKFLDWINQNYFELGLFDEIDIRSLAEIQ